MSNFSFLNDINPNLYIIITEAEKLFRDEYFSQVVIQTRRFAENLCKDLLGEDMPVAASFDDMINCLKDKSFDNIRLQEFTNDLFYLKKQGNNSVHSSLSKNDGKIALECLERAFEISIFYSEQKFGYNKKLDKLVFSEEMLMTGKSSNKSFKEKYVKELEKERKASTKKKKTNSNITSNKISKVSQQKNSKKADKLSKEEIISILYRTIVIATLSFIMVAYLWSCFKALFHL